MVILLPGPRVEAANSQERGPHETGARARGSRRQGEPLVPYMWEKTGVGAGRGAADDTNP